MRITTNMWHPAGEARQYEAAGSRTSFKDRWNQPASHSLHSKESVSDALQMMLDVLTDEQKVLYSFEPGA
jgi:hypothetical protein